MGILFAQTKILDWNVTRNNATCYNEAQVFEHELVFINSFLSIQIYLNNLVMTRFMIICALSFIDDFNRANKCETSTRRSVSEKQNLTPTHLKHRPTHTDQTSPSLQDTRMVFIWGQETGVSWHPATRELYQKAITFLRCSINMWSGIGVTHTFTTL